MSTAPIELDFFGTDNRSASRFAPQRMTCVREIQNAITRLDRRLLKTVISSGSATGPNSPGPTHRPPSPTTVAADVKKMGFLSQLPQCDHDSRRRVKNPTVETRMTIFYNGSVSVFDLSRETAEKIIKSAEDVLDAANLKRDVEQSNEEDLPIARRRSLRRFLEKRKGRLICVSPYEMGASNENGKGLDLTFGTF